MTEREHARADRHEHESPPGSTPTKRGDNGERDREPEHARVEVEDASERLGFQEGVDEPTRCCLVGNRKLVRLLGDDPPRDPENGVQRRVQDDEREDESSRNSRGTAVEPLATSSQSRYASPPMRKSCAMWSQMNNPVSSPTSGLSVCKSPRTT